MGSVRILPNHAATFVVAASDKIAAFSDGEYSIDKIVGYPNLPDTSVNVFEGAGANTTAAFTDATDITIRAGDSEVLYNLGTDPVIFERANAQGAPGTLNATGTLTAALILAGIVTTTSVAAVTATLDTGEAMDAALTMDIGDSFDWAVINTGGNTLTVTAATGHTVVGSGAAVVTHTSSQFRTRKTAAATYVTYCLASAAS